MLLGAIPVSFASVNKQMQKIAQSLQEIYPLMFRPVNQLTVRDKKKISNHVSYVKNQFQSLDSHLGSEKVTFRVSHTVMKQYTEDIQKVFSNGHFYFGQKMMHGLTKICISCHRHDRKTQSIFSSLSRNRFSTDLMYADFLFSVRDYKRALKYYDFYLNSVNSEIEDKNVPKVLFKRLTYYIAIKDDLYQATDYLSQEHRFIKSPTTKILIEQWKLTLKKLLRVKLKPSFESIKAELEKLNFDGLLSYGSRKLEMLYWQNKLIGHLQKSNNKKEVPELLYWLARLERKLENNIFYSIADLYLKECVFSYSSMPIAKQCYREYYDHVLFFFTGSRGTDLPKDIQNELSRMRSKLY